jgi:hypothetical protein
VDGGLAADRTDSDVVNKNGSGIEIEAEFELMGKLESSVELLFSSLPFYWLHVLYHDRGVGAFVTKV